MGNGEHLKPPNNSDNAGGQNKLSFLNKDSIKIRKDGNRYLIETLDRFGNLTLDQLQEVMKRTGELTVKDAFVAKMWQKVLTSGNVNHIRVILAIYGIPTDIKSIHYNEIEDAYGSGDKEKIKDVTPVAMTSNDRIEMLQRMIEIEKTRGKK